MHKWQLRKLHGDEVSWVRMKGVTKSVYSVTISMSCQKGGAEFLIFSVTQP